MEPADYQNFHAMIESIVEKRPDMVAFRWFVDDQGNRDGVTWIQFYEQVKQVAKSLIAMGIKKDDKVNIISNTCYRWTLTDIGIIFAGGRVEAVRKGSRFQVTTRIHRSFGGIALRDGSCSGGKWGFPPGYSSRVCWWRASP